ncbi:MAG: minor capsid protein [Magnetococcales bacterium]|nr:minor capsid protein [Magnetococcales bacterium]
MPTTADTALSALFRLPPEQAMRFLAEKGHRVTWNWDEMTGPEHAKAFTVAKVTRLDLLADIHQAVSKALAEGQTERMFAKDLIPILQKKGWWGLKTVTNPDGEEQQVQLGNLHRLETIFRTNLQTAYMAGRYQQMKQGVKNAPYWQYLAVMDSRTRSTHAALHGRVFRHDDPVWNHIYPPNGFRCRCRIRSLSEFRVKQSGVKVESSEGYLTQLTGQGEDRLAPRVALKMPGMSQAFIPDRGWDYNPGAAWGRWDKAGLLPDCPGDGAAFAQSEEEKCVVILPNQKNWLHYGRPDLRDVGNDLRLPAPSLLEVGKDGAQALLILQTALGVSPAKPLRVINTPVDQVPIRFEFLPHLVKKREHRREVTANYIIPTLENPYEVWLTAYEDGFRKRYIGLFQDQRDILSVVKENQDGSLLWNVIRMRDTELNKQRTGSLIWKK